MIYEAFNYDLSGLFYSKEMKPVILSHFGTVYGHGPPLIQST